MKRQQVRKLILFSSLLLFPITMNFLSPYLIVNGSFEGVLTGSALVFISMFLFSVFFGRLFCGWICPAGGLNEMLIEINGKRVTSKAAKRVKYVIWILWLASIVGGFIAAGGLKVINPLYMTETGISVDEPFKYITYYFVILLFAVISVFAGRRASCHTICWMAPFMVFGKKASDVCKIPAMRIHSDSKSCIKCKKCIDACPMSIDVMNQLDGKVAENMDCILCGMCVDTCPKKCLSYKMK